MKKMKKKSQKAKTAMSSLRNAAKDQNYSFTSKRKMTIANTETRQLTRSHFSKTRKTTCSYPLHILQIDRRTRLRRRMAVEAHRRRLRQRTPRPIGQLVVERGEKESDDDILFQLRKLR